MSANPVDRARKDPMANTRSTTTEAWRSARKAEGGRKSRMPKRWGSAELDRPSGDLTGLSVQQQAEALSTLCSTIDRMRRAARARPTAK